MPQYVGTLPEFEDRERRSKVLDHEIGKTFSRVYVLPSDARDLIPVRGALLTLQDDDPLAGDLGTTGAFKARVLSATHAYDDSEYVVTVQAILPVAYSSETADAAYQEVRGSRDESETSERKIAIEVGLSTDGTGNPSRGTIYPADVGITKEELFGRHVTKIDVDRETVPGLYLIRTTYEAFIAYTTVDEDAYQLIKGTHNPYENPTERGIVELGISESVGAGPSYGTVFPGDAGGTDVGLFGRHVAEITEDVETIPGIVLIRTTYKAPLNFTTLTTAKYQEVRGSRTEQESFEQRSILKIGISSLNVDNGSYDGPVKGDQFTGDSGLFGRRCKDIQVDRETYPGLFLIRATYVNFLNFTTINADAFQEIKGSRDEHDSPTRRRAIIQGITADGTGGPSKGDFFTGDSGILGRVCNNIVVDREAVPGIYMIRATYTAFVAYAGETAGLVEIRGNRVLRRKAVARAVGLREFISDTGSAQSYADELFGTRWPDSSGSYTPRCYEPEVIDHPEGIPDISMIRAHYRSARATDLRNDEARLITTIASRREKRHTLKDGTIIHGLVPKTLGRNRRRIVRGSETVLVPYPSYIIQAQMARIKIPYAEIYATVGGLNKHGWKKPRAAPAHLLFVGAKIVETTEGRSTVDFYLDGNFDGFQTLTTIRSEARQLRQEPVVNAAGNETGTRTVVVWMARKAWKDETDELLDQADVTLDGNDYPLVNLAFIRKLKIVE